MFKYPNHSASRRSLQERGSVWRQFLGRRVPIDCGELLTVRTSQRSGTASRRSRKSSGLVTFKSRSGSGFHVLSQVGNAAEVSFSPLNPHHTTAVPGFSSQSRRAECPDLWGRLSPSLDPHFSLLIFSLKRERIPSRSFPTLIYLEMGDKEYPAVSEIGPALDAMCCR
jgi:hypothetical protein